MDTSRAVAVEFTESSHTEPPRWRDAGTLSNIDLWLTVDEMESVAEQLGAVLKPYRERTLAARRPAGSRRVRVMNLVVPHRQPAAGGSGG